MARAAEAKRRIDAMNAQQSTDGAGKKTSFEMLEECKCQFFLSLALLCNALTDRFIDAADVAIFNWLYT